MVVAGSEFGRNQTAPRDAQVFTAQADANAWCNTTKATLEECNALDATMSNQRGVDGCTTFCTTFYRNDTLRALECNANCTRLWSIVYNIADRTVNYHERVRNMWSLIAGAIALVLGCVTCCIFIGISEAHKVGPEIAEPQTLVVE